MYFDIFLFSALAVTGYLGVLVVRRQPPGQRLFGWLLIGDGIAAALALGARHSEGAEQSGDLLGFIALGAALFLTVVPAILRDWARRAVQSERLLLALRLIDLWELLQPGMGASRQREVVEMLVAVRSGQIDDVITALREARSQIHDPLARRQLDERIVATFLSAQRWQDAIAAYEGSLAAELPSPHLCVEMVWAYCEVGDLETAGHLISRLSQLSSQATTGEQALLSFLLNRARLIFLAFVGRRSAVEHLVSPAGPLGILPPASQHYWSGIARLNAGDRSGARSSLEGAVRLARRDPRARELAERLIASLENMAGVAAPRTVSPAVAEMADRFSADASASPAASLPVIPRLSEVPWRQIPVTIVLVAANLGIFAAVMLLFGSTGDAGALVLAGANVKSWVAAGQWWRLISYMFLHVGLAHLLLNMYGLWVLGKLVEQMVGSMRMFAIYTAAGIVGALASTAFGGPGISAGASGAVLGLLWALIAELTLHRGAYPRRWRRGLLGPLIFVAAAQVLVGFLYPAIDQWAHLGGLIAGACSSALLSRKSSWGTSLPGNLLALILTGIGLFGLVYGIYGLVSTDYRAALAGFGDTQEYRVGGLAFTGPKGWHVKGSDVVANELPMQLRFAVTARCEPGSGGQNPPCVVSSQLDQEMRVELEAEIRTADAQQVTAPPRPLDLPPPWRSHQITVTLDGFGGAEHYRLVRMARVHDDEVWRSALQVPEALVHVFEPVLIDILSSLHRSEHSAP